VSDTNEEVKNMIDKVVDILKDMPKCELENHVEGICKMIAEEKRDFLERVEDCEPSEDKLKEVME